MSKRDMISVLRDTLDFIEERQSKARGIETFTKIQDRAVRLLEVIEVLEREARSVDE